MAALGANAVNIPRPDPAYPVIERIYGCAAADEFYVGACVTRVNGAGTVAVTGANADWSIGFTLRRATTTAAAQPINVCITGVWWVAATLLADAALWTTAHQAANSDNPADICVTAGGAPSALGLLVHVDVTTVSGWIHLGHRTLPTNS